MSIKSFYTTVGVIFALVLVLYLARIILGWSAVIYEVVIPAWVSWVAVMVFTFLLYQGYKFRKQLY